MNDYPIHPIAELFPPMREEEFAAFKADIEKRGLKRAIQLLDGQVIDGRHRLRACVELGIEAEVEDYPGTEEQALADVMSENLHRRHMTSSQRSMVLGRIATLSRGRPGINTEISAFTQQQAAEMLKVSVDSGQFAKQVLELGAPELVVAVDQGDVSVSAAAVVAKALPKEEQAKVVAEGKVAKVAKEVKAKKSGKPKAPKAEPKPAEVSEVHGELPDESDHLDLAGELEALAAENKSLKEQIAALTTGDVEAELVREIQTRQGIEARLQQEMDRNFDFQRQLNKFGETMRRLRDLTGAKTNGEIVSRVKALVG